MESQMLDIRDLARITKISIRHARRLIRDGLLPAPVRLGKCQRWPKAQIEAWMKDAAKTGGCK